MKLTDCEFKEGEAGDRLRALKEPALEGKTLSEAQAFLCSETRRFNKLNEDLDQAAFIKGNYELAKR